MSDNPYADHERDRWGDPAKNRYCIKISATRNSEGEDPVEFYLKVYNDSDYASMLAILGAMEQVGVKYVEAMAEWIGLPPEDQTATRLAMIMRL